MYYKIGILHQVSQKL